MFNKFSRFCVAVFVPLVLVSIFGCATHHNEVDSSFLSTRWESSHIQGSVSWWYMGEEDGYHFLMEKWPDKKYHYKIKKTELFLSTGHKFYLTSNEREWVKIKPHHIKFN